MTSLASKAPRPTLALVGATGAVGRVTQQVLAMREDIWGEIRAAAAPEDAGTELTVCGRDIVVQRLTPEFFDGVDIALVDLPAKIAAEWAQIAAARGTVVIDNSSALRGDPDIPLVVPEVNPHQIHHRPKGIIASPGATTLTIIDALGVLHAGWELTELVVATYQAASGAGRAGMARLHDEIEVVAGHRELGHQPGDVRRLIEFELGTDSPFPAPLALNVLPWIGTAAEDGWTSEELKIRNETRKVLGLPDLRVSATCVRVPGDLDALGGGARHVRPSHRRGRGAAGAGRGPRRRRPRRPGDLRVPDAQRHGRFGPAVRGAAAPGVGLPQHPRLLHLR